MKPNFIILLLFAFLASSFKSKLTVDEILEKHVEAMGGEENLSKITSVHFKYKSKIIISEIAINNGKEYLSRMNIGGNEFLQYAKDTIAKSCMSGVLKNASDKTKAQLLNETYIFKLFKAKERGWDFTINEEESNWRYFALDGVNDSLNIDATFYITKRTYLIRYVKGGSFFNSEYKKYMKTSHGVKFPRIINTKGIPFTKGELTDLEFNKPLNDLNKAFYAKCGVLN